MFCVNLPALWRLNKSSQAVLDTGKVVLITIMYLVYTLYKFIDYSPVI